MKRSDAIAIFGTVPGLAKAIGVTRGRIYQLPEELPQEVVDRIVGAAVRLGRPLPLALKTSAQPASETSPRK